MCVLMKIAAYITTAWKKSQANILANIAAAFFIIAASRAAIFCYMLYVPLISC